MSGYKTKTVQYSDPWDVGKFYNKDDDFYLEYNGTSDTVGFYRNDKCIVMVSKGEAWLLMCALQKFVKYEELNFMDQKNPFEEIDELPFK